MLKWLLVFLAGALVGANAVYFLMTRDAAPAAAPILPSPQLEEPRPTDPAPPERLPVAPQAAVPAGPGALLVPVQGVTADQLSNTFADARGSDRVHDAIDIMAPHGTPVLAVADGNVEKLFDSKQGGLTLYQFDPGGTFAYYYAHLERYAPGVVEGKRLRRGEVIGFVGSTGNADVAAPHLHFAVFMLGPQKKWHKGTPINPYPLLVGR